MSDKVISSTTQEFLDVYDIVNDMVLLKDGSAAIILQVGTMNFSLLAEQEQDAVIFTYGSVLNSLNYPIQINIQSQTKDATKYLRLLDEQIAKASSERRATLIKKYRSFVEGLIKERNVLQKRFFIIASASPSEMGLITPSSVLPGQGAFNVELIEKSILLEKAINVLEPRRDHLVSQFNRLGLFARQLTTQEIIQNFYINYNPEAAEGQEISSSENYTTPLVRASFGGKFMQLNNIMQNQAAANQASGGQTQVADEPGQLVDNQSQMAPSETSQAAAPVDTLSTAEDPTSPVGSPVEPTIQEQPTLTDVQFVQEQPQATESSQSPTLESAPTQMFPPPAGFPGAESPVTEVAAENTPAEPVTADPNPDLNLSLDPTLLAGANPANQSFAEKDSFIGGPVLQPDSAPSEPDTPLSSQPAAAASAPQEAPVNPNTPTVETAPIIDNSFLAAGAGQAAPSSPQEPSVNFAEEAAPLKIQDDAKDV